MPTRECSDCGKEVNVTNLDAWDNRGELCDDCFAKYYGSGTSDDTVAAVTDTTDGTTDIEATVDNRIVRFFNERIIRRPARRAGRVAVGRYAYAGLFHGIIKKKLFSLVTVAILLAISLTFFNWINGLWWGFFFLFIYTIFPSESEVYGMINSRLQVRKVKDITEKKTYEEMRPGERFALMFRQVFKFFTFAAFAIAFGSLYALLAFAIIFIGYFFFPTEYTQYRPDRAVGAWVRVVIGFMLAMVVYQFLVVKQVTWTIIWPPTWVATFFEFFTGIGMVGIILALIFGIIATIFNLNRKILLLITMVYAIFGVILGQGVLGLRAIGQPGVLALFSIAIAFFAVFPRRRDLELKEDKISVMITNVTQLENVRKSMYYGSEGFGLGFFLMFMVLALGDMSTWGFDLLRGPGLTIFLIWIIALLTGIFTGRENRPYIGVVLIGVAFIAFSFAFTGVVGSALFGQFWPVVENFGTTTLEPIGDAFSGVTDSMGDTYLLLTCPSCYYQKQAEQQRTTSKVVSGGTVKAIDSRFELIGGVTEIDPEFPLAGTIEVTNRGEFTANELKIRLEPLWLRDPISQVYTPVGGGVFGRFRSCSNGAVASQPRPEAPGSSLSPLFNIIIPVTNNTCIFNTTHGGPIYPGDIRLITFQYDDNEEEARLGELYDCECNKFVPCSSYNNEEDCETQVVDYLKTLGQDRTGCYWDDNSETCLGEGVLIEMPSYSNCADIKDCVSAGGTMGYVQAGNYTKLNFSYEFEYTANVSMEVDIIGSKLFSEKLENREIMLLPKTSQYQGGPVRAAIWTQKQPIQGNETTFGEISITNQIGGIVKDASMELLIPVEFEQFGASPFITCPNPREVRSGTFRGYFTTTCTLDPEKILEKDDVVRYKFEYTYDIGDYDEQTSLLLGMVNYTYVGENSLELPIAQIPLQ